jgi:hypothetical protein
MVTVNDSAIKQRNFPFLLQKASFAMALRLDFCDDDQRNEGMPASHFHIVASPLKISITLCGFFL